MRSYCLPVIAVGWALILLSACGPDVIRTRPELDTPQHHSANGEKLLNVGKPAAALREYARAVELDPGYTPGHVGFATTAARAGEFGKVRPALDAALDSADTDADKLSALTAFVRLFALYREKISGDWFDQAEKAYAAAVAIDPNAPGPPYFMGLADKHVYRFEEAGRMFARALECGGAYTHDADREYAVIQMIRRAMPGTPDGKRIAVLNAVSRADMSALLDREMDIGRLFSGQPTPDVAVPADVKGHPLSSEIKTVLSVGLRGLEPYPGGAFMPDRPVLRAEFAMAAEDLLGRITGDPALATAYVGAVSPFPDLREDLPYFNAAMVCVTRNILAVRDTRTGAFEPLTPVTGAEALLAVRVLKSRMR